MQKIQYGVEASEKTSSQWIVGCFGHCESASMCTTVLKQISEILVPILRRGSKIAYYRAHNSENVVPLSKLHATYLLKT